MTEEFDKVIERSQLSEDSLFRVNTFRDTATGELPEDSGVWFYTIFGKHISLDPNGFPMAEEKSPWVAAMKHKQKYYIKHDSFGQLFDPKEFKNGDPVIRNGVPLFTMRRVNKEQFEAYMSFLKTGEKLYLTIARKIMGNV